MVSDSDILIVGAGAKAAAIGAKVHVLNSLGLADISMTVIEKTEPAASWKGRNGMTSGEEPLAIPPIKDVGFPYQSSRQFGDLGDEIDAELLPFTWQRFAMERHEYAAWVNSGSPSVLHQDYGEYLAWVLEQTTNGVTIYDGRVTEVSFTEEGDRWQVEVAERGGPEDPERHTGRNLILTGPGVHRHFPHDPEVESRVFHCDSRREEFARVPLEERSEIAIVGGGESALSALVFLRDLRPNAHLTIYTASSPTPTTSAGNTSTSRPAATSSSTATAASSTRPCSSGSPTTTTSPSSPAAPSTSPSPRTARRRCSNSRAPPRASAPSATTSSSTAPASTSCVSCVASFPTPSATRSKNSAAHSGTARRRPRFRSVAASNWKGCGRGCTSPASAACVRARASPTSAASACSPTACCNHCSPNSTCLSRRIQRRCRISLYYSIREDQRDVRDQGK
jgi:hypothetical protein